jgi:hypothetical protein
LSRKKVIDWASYEAGLNKSPPMFARYVRENYVRLTIGEIYSVVNCNETAIWVIDDKESIVKLPKTCFEIIKCPLVRPRD